MRPPDTIAEHIRRQIEYAHQLIDRFSADLSFEQAVWGGDEGKASISWLIGHMADNTRVICRALSATTPREADEYPHQNVRIQNPDEWAALKLDWSNAALDLRNILTGFKTESLSEPPGIDVHPAFKKTHDSKYAFIAGHIFHLNYHLGQIGRLRAELGLIWPMS